MKNIYVKWFIAYLCFLIALICLPIGAIGDFFDNNSLFFIRLDHWVHAALMLPWMSFYLFVKKVFKITRFGWFFIGFLVAVLIELIQYPLYYRSFNLYDMRANLIGLIIGTILCQFVIYFFQKEKASKR